MRFLWTVAGILVKNAANSLGFGLGDSAVEIWNAWNKETPSTEGKLAEVQEVAQLSPAEAGDLAKKIVLELASDQPDTFREQIAAVLTQVPQATRRSLRRPEDPSGKSLRPSTAVDGPESVRLLLPAGLPRFKAGDTPLAGVDLELVELLGVGGFGEVWKARNPFLDGVPPVALKFCTDKEAARTLRHEAGVLNQVMRQGTHPGIVKLLHSYLRSEPPCLEYEHVEGGDLAGVIRDWHRSGAFSLDLVTQTVLHLAEIVGFAHRLSPPVVHRDLKPANVLVQRGPGGALQLKVADFGIGGIAAGQAIKDLSQKPAWHMTALATGTCTPLYASPQQAAGKPPDPRDDVFSLGVLWYQMLTGSLASGRPGGSGWKKKLLAQGAKADLVELLESCFEDEPDHRPRDAAELAERLKVLVEQASSVSVEHDHPEGVAGGEEGAKPEEVDSGQQPARLRLGREPAEISGSLRTFNGQAKANAARAMKILRQTSYWVYDQGQDAFGPSKFVGYAGMDFAAYEKATSGEALGDRFDGYASRTAITEALGSDFTESPNLVPRLTGWGEGLLHQPGLFAGIDQGKWRFVVIGRPGEAAPSSQPSRDAVALKPTGETVKTEGVEQTEEKPVPTLLLWQQCTREQIPPLFGLEFSQAVWNVGYVRRDKLLFLLVTLEKEGVEEKFQYKDHFLGPDLFHWQSQNRTRKDSQDGQALSRHRELGFTVHLFVRATKKLKGRPVPFRYCGEVSFVEWENEAPITIRWRLAHPVPEHLREELQVPG
jgi:serine/threonine protein kinase